MEQAVAAPYRVIGHIMPSNIPGKECRVYKKPLGVVAVIGPWDFAMHLSNRSIAPAVAVGNAVVLKPSSDTPVTGGLMLAKINEEAGLPAGVFNVVVGSGSEIGTPFALHPIPRLNSFTGSTAVGREIGLNSMKSPVIKKVALELGGNGPLVILDDADMDVAVNAAVFGKFINQGQICMIANRIIVHQDIHDEFVRRLVERVKQLKVGDPKDPKTIIGPIINQQQFKGIMAHIESARKEGAKEVLGGAPKGLVIPPHIFTGVTMKMTIAREEIFGPLFSSSRCGMKPKLCGSPTTPMPGLTGSVITRDENRGLAFALQMEAGMTHVNDQPVNDLANNPFGGEKNSGLGRFGGDWIIDESYHRPMDHGAAQPSAVSFLSIGIRDGSLYRMSNRSRPCQSLSPDTTRERKCLEEALEESEEKYRTIVEGQTELITRFLPDTVLTFVNGAYCRYFEQPLSECSVTVRCGSSRKVNVSKGGSAFVAADQSTRSGLRT